MRTSLEIVSAAGALALAVLFWRFFQAKITALKAVDGRRGQRLELQIVWASIIVFIVGIFAVSRLMLWLG